jgi:hypothetical protein
MEDMVHLHIHHNKVSVNHCITIENFKQTQELKHIATSIT